jgi:Domain of unknown function (DUF4386)
VERTLSWRGCFRRLQICSASGWIQLSAEGARGERFPSHLWSDATCGNGGYWHSGSRWLLTRKRTEVQTLSRLYRSGLVPRLIPVLGLLGAPLLIASATATLFRSNDPVTVLAAIGTAPIFLWELSLGVWLVVKGFKPSPITTDMVAGPTLSAHRDINA